MKREEALKLLTFKNAPLPGISDKFWGDREFVLEAI